jgi:hypothetical protein
VKACANCEHPRAIHRTTGECRFNGCSCPGFDDGSPEGQAPRSRRVCVDVPDGYAVQIQLLPTEGPTELPRGLDGEAAASSSGEPPRRGE